MAMSYKGSWIQALRMMTSPLRQYSLTAPALLASALSLFSVSIPARVQRVPISLSASAALGAEVDQDWSSNPMNRFSYMQDGSYYEKIGVPTYEWLPRGFGHRPKGMILFVHGLTLHGRRYDVAGRAFAAGNYYALAFDMRGFGRCYSDPDHKYCSGEDCKRKVNFKKSFEEMASLAKLMKQRYPGVPLFLVGESLGATPCLQLAAECSHLVNGIIISGPAVHVNPRMLFSAGSVLAGLRGLIIDPRFRINLSFFMTKLVSDDSRIVEELTSDPLMRRQLTIRELLATDSYVARNRRYARLIPPDLPVLLLQGKRDKCVIPTSVVALASSIQSDDQTLRWFDHLSHLLLETRYLQPRLVDSIASWMTDHEDKHRAELEATLQELKTLGADGL